MRINALWKDLLFRVFLKKNNIRVIKLTAFLMLCFCLQLSAGGISQTISYSGRNVPLKTIFTEIKKQTGHFVFYNRSFLKDTKPVTVSVKNEPLENFIRAVLWEQELDYLFKDKSIIIIKKPQTAREIQQNKIQESPAVADISGRVTDDKGNPLSGASVKVKGTSQGVSTNADGTFTLRFTGDDALLEISFVGFQTRTIAVSAGAGFLSIELAAEQTNMNEVVLIGYGAQRKMDMTGSVVSVKDDVIRNRPVNTLNQALVGQLAGVAVAQNDAAPGGETSIKIRGLGSISGGNEPLYVIDGFPSTQAFANAILPADIASVDVLKDASATAIYGSRGSNGVVLITTKSGTRGAPVISVNAAHGFAAVNKNDYYDLLSGSEYVEYARELRNNQWVREAPGNTPGDPNNVRPPQFQIPDFLTTWNGVNTNWQNAIFEPAAIDNYDLSVRGGSDNVRYFFSGGYSGDNGVLIGTGYKKFTARIKVDADLAGDKLQAGLNIAPSYSRQKVAKYSGTNIYESVIASALAMPPIIPVYNEDGTYADRMKPIAGFLPIPNPVQLANEIQNNNRTFATLFNSYLQYNIMKGLELRTNFGATFIYDENDFYHPTTAPRFFAPPPVDASASAFSGSTYNILSETTIKYKTSFAQKHKLDVLGGYSYQREHNRSNSVNANNFPNDLVQTVNAGQIVGGGSSKTEWSLISYLGRANYSFDDKYLLTATFRTDGSSRFGANNKWGFFPSAAVGWVVSNEGFMDQGNTVTYLKLRASYGYAGNNAIGNYSHIGLLANTNQTFGTGGGTNYFGIYPTTLSNQNLSWEKSKEFNAGVDLGFFNDRIVINADYYRRITTDLLLRVNLPSTTGFSSVLTNIGEVENTGFEMVLNTRNIVRGDLKWNTSFNIAKNTNEVLKLGPAGDPIYDFAGTRVTEVGGPIGANRGLVQIGVLTQKDIDAGVAVFPGQTAGDVKYLDVNGDGTISNFNGDDGVQIGDANPKYVFGMNNNVEYRNFTLGIMIIGQSGGKTMDLTSQGLWDPDGSNVMKKQWEGRYQSDAVPGNNVTPRAGMIAGGLPDTRLVQKTDYLRIRNITLAYDLSSRSIRPLKGMRVYASVENLFTWTDFEGFNPQSTAFGAGQTATINGLTGGGSYPLPRVISLGVNLTL